MGAHLRSASFACLALGGALVALVACGPIPPPANTNTAAPDMQDDMLALRGGVQSFRIAGSVTHVGKQRVQGKAFLFAELPTRLRVDILSPFGTTLSVLTVDDGHFALSDHREGHCYSGPAAPCNIARLIGVSLPAEDLIQLVLGQVPLIEPDRPPTIQWLRSGFYRVTLQRGHSVQHLDIDPDREILPLHRAVLEERKKVVYEVSFSRWRQVASRMLPLEVRIRMPADNAEVILRYETHNIELDVALPDDAWRQQFPAGCPVHEVHCD